MTFGDSKLSATLCLLGLLSGCTVYVLPELDSASDESGASTDVAGDETGATPTTGAAPTSEAQPTGDPTGPDACDFAGAIQPIFTASCGCHGGPQPQQGLSLAEGSAFAALVGVDSSQQPGTARVEPGDPAGSYLMIKLEPDPPVGAQMPVGGALSPEQVARISAWISAGAPETAPFECAGAPQDGEVGEVEIAAEGPVQVQVGQISQLAALVTDPEGEPLPAAALTWTSSGELTLYVDGAGALLGVAPGTVQVHASAGGVDSAPITVEVVDHDPPAATFTAVRAITSQRCAVAGCHVDGVEPGDLRFDREPDRIWEELLEDEAEQVDGLARVAPNAPTQSYMFQKLVQRSPAVGAQMPIGGAPIDAASAQVILRWILDGAPYN